MKAKKNLYDAPATEVAMLVEHFIYDVELFMTEENGTLHRECFDGVFDVLDSLQEWRMPKDIVKRSIFGTLDDEDLEDEIMTWVTAQYHKSLAA